MLRRNAMPALTGCLLLAVAPIAGAAVSEELLELKNTILNLVDELVEQGILSAEKASQMKADAAAKARAQAEEEAGAAGAVSEAPADAPPGVVRVPYVPEFVKDQIRDEVRQELREDVTEDVVAMAREEKWGTPDALPGWMSAVTLSGDARVRYIGVFQDPNNSSFFDFAAINDAGGISSGAPLGDLFLNTIQDIDRYQLRLRLGLAAQISENFSLVTRFATGNDTNPTTRNQTLGDFGRPYDFFIDRAYLQGEWMDLFGSQRLTFQGGRVPNPFMYTPLVFDDDLTFEGVTLSYEVPFGSSSVFATVGGYNLLDQEFNAFDSSTNEKYWWATQLGVDLAFTQNTELKVAAATYNFRNVTGRRNSLDSMANDWTANPVLSKGNTVFDIANDSTPGRQLFALASEYELVNLTAEAKYTGFAPVNVILRADYVENTGFDADDVSARVGLNVEERNRGWLGELEVGYAEPRALGEWQAFAGYRYLQRDAVIAALTDSNFRAGGTDAEGWVAGFLFGVSNGTWLRFRWFTADEIDGAIDSGLTGLVPAGAAGIPLQTDVFQAELNVEF